MKSMKKTAFPLVLLIFAVMMTGCGVSHKTPQAVVESLLQAYAGGKEKAVRECYELEGDTPEELQKEIDATIKYFGAHETSKVKIAGCDVLTKTDKYIYVYVVYNLVLKDEQEYPCISTYMVKKNDDKNYAIMAPSEITSDMSKQAATDYAKFMTTDTYKNYNKAYNTFLKKNPGYEEKIAEKLN